ncbi:MULTISPECIES: hypothetical protein [unclassified Streptomyces]|uniref:hypothetical protein n=1 Tax=unclassified Streptomyces TaxID=2593676 RepID=UPI002E332230|nr:MULTISPECIES: hypothetical protein [unclassified Streptomyces]
MSPRASKVFGGTWERSVGHWRRVAEFWKRAGACSKPFSVAVTGGPDTAQRPITAFELPGFTPSQPLLNPVVNQLADKLVLLTGKPRGLREAPDGPWHRYKDVFGCPTPAPAATGSPPNNATA